MQPYCQMYGTCIWRYLTSFFNIDIIRFVSTRCTLRARLAYASSWSEPAPWSARRGSVTRTTGPCCATSRGPEGWPPMVSKTESYSCQRKRKSTSFGLGWTVCQFMVISCFFKLLVLFLSGGFTLKEVMDLGKTSENVAKLESVADTIQSDDPNNIQFTSVQQHWLTLGVAVNSLNTSTTYFTGNHGSSQGRHTHPPQCGQHGQSSRTQVRVWQKGGKSKENSPKAQIHFQIDECFSQF